jgi:hypothetical protein
LFLRKRAAQGGPVFIACVAVTVVTALFLALSARLKFTRNPDTIAKLGTVGVAVRWFVPLGTLEVLGAAGTLIGLVVAPLGIAAGAGLVGYFIVAMAAHVVHDDLRGVGPALWVFAWVVATLVTRIVSL